MAHTKDYLAADLGASNGRVLAAGWDGERFALHELHRFANGPVRVLGGQQWNILGLWSEIKSGMARYGSEFGRQPAGIGIDTWGVDFALLDRAGQMLGNPVHYRDTRTDGMQEVIFSVVGREEIFRQTGIQFMQINTLVQLFSLRRQRDPQLEIADLLLMIPDLLHYWLTGRKVAEYTIASTSQMLHAEERRWATGLLARLHLPTHLLPPIVEPGVILGPLVPDVAEEVGMDPATPVIAVGSHDTASAVAAVPGLDERSAYISSGTWSLMGVEISQPIINEQTLKFNFTNEGGVSNTIRLLKNIGGLWLLQESRRQWQRSGRDYTWEELLALGEEAQPFRSLVNPDAEEFLNPPDMLGALRTFCLHNGQPEPESVGQIVRCCLESLALRYRWVLEALEMLVGHRLEVVRIVGGGSQNRLLCQLTADACQRPVVAGPVEATALGNVMVQAIASGELSGLAEGRAAIAASIVQEQFEPGDSAGWDEAFGRFVRLE